MKGTMKWCTFLFYTLWAIVTPKNSHWFQHWLNNNFGVGFRDHEESDRDHSSGVVMAMQKKSKDKFNVVPIIIIILILSLVGKCNSRGWLNQSKPNTDPKTIENLIEKLKKHEKRN